MIEFAEIKLLLAKALNIDPDGIKLLTAKSEIDEWDSLGQISIVTTIESYFGVKFEDSEIFSFSNPKELCYILETHGIKIKEE